MKNVHLDFETACSLDLARVGLHRYIEDSSFQPLCVAWKADGELAVVARLDARSTLPPALHRLLVSPGVKAHAWNAAFEDRILRAHYAIKPGQRLCCTMQRALGYGLPASLAKAGPALGTEWLKDAAGHRLMLKMSRAPGAAWTDAEWDRLLAYCRGDVLSEAEISGLVPELPEAERALSEVDRAMNTQGIWVDTGMVRLLAQVAREAEKAEAARAAELSEGAVTSPGTQVARLLKWLATRGMVLPGLSRDAVKEALASPLGAPDAEAVEMLGIRLRTARASAKKLKRMLGMVSAGDRLRGQFQFLGAARTGRWAGRGVQVQNLPRVPKGFSPPGFIAMARASVTLQQECNSGGCASNRPNTCALDAVTDAPVLDCVSWSLRACLGTGLDAPLWSYDFSQIEARVLAWLAGQQDVLDVFRSGEDVYAWAARQFGSDNRQLGKVLILALGFGMGAAKLRDTAWKDHGVAMTAAEAERFKTGWRARNPHIVAFWGAIGEAARSAILQQGRVFEVMPSAISLTATARTLQMRLPSGRMLYYHRPHVGPRGEITYRGEELGQWVQRRTWGGTLAENATQAVARDIMAEAMLRVSARTGLTPLMCVHDELVYGAGDENGRLEQLLKEAPSWAGGLPIDGEAKVMARYGVVTKR